MIYFKYLKMLIKSILQYRSAFWMTMIGQFFVSFFTFLGIYLLFDRFGTVNGWSLGEVSVCFAVISISFSIVECFTRGFNYFSQTIVSGDFDRLLIRPRGTVLQVFGSDFALYKIGGLVQSFVILALAVSWLQTHWNILKVMTLIFMIISGVFVFSGIFILGASICFFTVQGLEIVNIFTHGGKEIASYPLSIYNKWVMRFFTFIIPFGAVNYLPLMFITDRVTDHAVLYMLTPLLGIIFIIPCLLLWRFGEKHYLSTGS